MLYNKRKEIPVFIYTDNHLLFNTIIPQQMLQKNNWELILLLLTIHSHNLHAMLTGFQQKNNQLIVLQSMVYQTNCYYLPFPMTICHKVIFVKLGCRQIAALIRQVIIYRICSYHYWNVKNEGGSLP